ncbi:MAG: DUF58 domain-containing protein [Alphaproteobacteria bacterium]|nr:DUF58 domain-containing protein [Alphaproteobacteria bacterium]
MKQLKKIAEKLFKNTVKDEKGNGLSVSLDELMDMRRFVKYLKFHHSEKTYSESAGDLKSAFKGRGIEMEEIRAYQFGDDVRDIDWRVTARKDQPYTKIYQEERDREFCVWLDLSPMMMFGSVNELKTVTAAKIAALLGWVALDHKDKFGCVIFDGMNTCFFKAKRDRAYLGAILKKISEISKISLYRTDFSEAMRLKSLQQLRLNVKNKSEVFVVSSLLDWNGEQDKELAALAHKTDLFMINVFDKLEIKAPVAGQYMAEYQGQKLVFDSSAKAYRKNYELYFKKMMQQKEDFCHRFNCRLVNFSAEMSYIKALKIF